MLVIARKHVHVRDDTRILGLPTLAPLGIKIAVAGQDLVGGGVFSSPSGTSNPRSPALPQGLRVGDGVLGVGFPVFHELGKRHDLACDVVKVVR